MTESETEDLPLEASRLAEEIGETLYYAGVLDSPGEARQWIENTKQDMREQDLGGDQAGESR